MHLSEENLFFVFSKHSCALSVQLNLEFFLFNLLSSEINSEKQNFATSSPILDEMKSLNQLKRPIACETCFCDFGGSRAFTAETLSGSALYPSLSIIRPKNLAV